MTASHAGMEWPWRTVSDFIPNHLQPGVVHARSCYRGTGLISTPIVRRLRPRGTSRFCCSCQTATRFEGPVTVQGTGRTLRALRGPLGYRSIGDRHADLRPRRRAQHRRSATRVRITCSAATSAYGGLRAFQRWRTNRARPSAWLGQAGGEDAFFAAHASSGFPQTLFRPSHCYGPGLLDIGGVISPACCVSRRHRNSSCRHAAGRAGGTWLPEGTRGRWLGFQYHACWAGPLRAGEGWGGLSTVKSAKNAKGFPMSPCGSRTNHAPARNGIEVDRLRGKARRSYRLLCGWR